MSLLVVPPKETFNTILFHVRVWRLGGHSAGQTEIKAFFYLSVITIA